MSMQLSSSSFCCLPVASQLFYFFGVTGTVTRQAQSGLKWPEEVFFSFLQFWLAAYKPLSAIMQLPGFFNILWITLSITEKIQAKGSTSSSWFLGEIKS